MNFDPSARTVELVELLESFMDEHIYPNEARFFRESMELGPWAVWPVVEELKPLAREAGLWNLFLPASELGAGLSNVEYAPLCEVMGRSHLAPEVFNCSAPDTGNMEVLARYGTPEQQQQWLLPLLSGEIRSAFAMTEPAVASSDATNIESSITRDGDDYVVSGRKWYTTNATDPRCKIIIFMGKSDPTNPDRHRQQSMILVPKDTPGVTVVRPLPVFNFYGMPDRASEVEFDEVRVPASNMLLGEGRGFEIAQGRLGPGRIHHCMRLIGLAERALEMMCRRTSQRVTFGRPISEQTVTLERIAESRIAIEQTRLLTLKTAHLMDTVGNSEARREIAMIKIAAPNMACKVVDWAIQAFGGAGTNNDFGLAAAYATARLLRLADGPDEVHRNSSECSSSAATRASPRSNLTTSSFPTGGDPSRRLSSIGRSVHTDGRPQGDGKKDLRESVEVGGRDRGAVGREESHRSKVVDAGLHCDTPPALAIGNRELASAHDVPVCEVELAHVAAPGLLRFDRHEDPSGLARRHVDVTGVLACRSAQLGGTHVEVA
jgi:acyl-CoA dehydrogenase